MDDSKSQGNSAGQALSSEGVFYLALLALQFGVQPLLIKEFTSYGLDKSGIVIIGELVKLVACTFMLLKSGEAANALASWKFYDALRCAGLPAVVYSVQNVAIQTAVQNMDGLTFNLLNQSKIIFTAICLYFMMGRKQSIQQCFALLGLFGASALLSHSKSLKTATSSKADELDMLNTFYWGIIPCLIASLLSGVASGLSQVALQGLKRNSFVFTMELAMFSISSVVCAEVAGRGGLGHLMENIQREFTYAAMIPITTNALGGIVVGLVVKHAGGVRKGFSIVGGILLTGFLQFALYEDTLSQEMLVALPVVIASTITHIRYPYVYTDEKKKQ